MKKLAFFVTAILLGVTIYGQQTDASGVTWGMVVSAVEKSDKNMSLILKVGFL